MVESTSPAINNDTTDHVVHFNNRRQDVNLLHNSAIIRDNNYLLFLTSFLLILLVIFVFLNIYLIVSMPTTKKTISTTAKAWWFAKEYYRQHPDQLKHKNNIKRLMKYLEEQQLHPLQPPQWRPQWVPHVIDRERYVPFGLQIGRPYETETIDLSGYKPRPPNQIEHILWPHYYTDKGPDPKKDCFHLSPQNLKKLSEQIYKEYGDKLFKPPETQIEPPIPSINKEDEWTEDQIDQYVNMVADAMEHCFPNCYETENTIEEPPINLDERLQDHITEHITTSIQEKMDSIRKTINQKDMDEAGPSNRQQLQKELQESTEDESSGEKTDKDSYYSKETINLSEAETEKDDSEPPPKKEKTNTSSSVPGSTLTVCQKIL